MASQSIQNIIIVGASGTIGAPILSALLSSGKFQVAVLSRLESKSTFPDGVEVKKVNFTSHSALVKAFKGQDAIICTINDEASGIQAQFIEAAIEAGVKRFVPNEWGGHEMKAPVPELEELMAAKRGIIELLDQKVAEAATAGKEFHWTGIDDGVFFDWAIKIGFLDVQPPPAKTAIIWDDGSGEFSATNLTTVAAAVVAILSTAEKETRDRFVTIESFKVSQNTIVQALEKATDATWAIEKTTSEEKLAGAKKTLEAGDFLTAFYSLILYVMFSGQEGVAFKTEKLDNKLLGLAEETLEGTVKAVVKSLNI